MREQVVEQLSSSTVDALKEEVASKWVFLSHNQRWKAKRSCSIMEQMVEQGLKHHDWGNFLLKFEEEHAGSRNFSRTYNTTLY